MKSATLMLMVLMLLVNAWSQEERSALDLGDTIDLINSRLSHSQIVAIDDQGQVRIKSPGQIIVFPIREVSFNYNDSDSRVRVAGDHNISHYEGDRLVELSHRQSFTCKSRRMAQDVIDALRRIKGVFLVGTPEQQRLERPLPVADHASGYESLGQAVDFINDSLSMSLILGIDDQGIMLINAPSALYRVDLRAAQFGINDGSDRAKIRMFGDWCISIFEGGDRRRERHLSRESFATHSGNLARESVKALYHIKGGLLGQRADQIEENTFLRGSIRESYGSVEEAIEYINDRLEISIITGLDEPGVMTVNASEQIYKIPLRSCRFRAGRNRVSFLGFGLFGGRGHVVEITCPKGLDRYSDRDMVRRVDGENFTARSKAAAKEIVRALEFLRNKVR